MNNHNDEPKSYLDWSSKGRANFWRYATGFVLMVFVFFLLSGMGAIPLILLAPDYKKSLLLSVVTMLLSFVISFFTIPLIVQLLHKRPSWSVAMPMLCFRSWDFFTGLWVAFVAAALGALLFGVAEIMPIERNPNFDLQVLLLLTVIGFAGIFIQAGAEELLFRGYITQFVRRFTSNRILFLGIPALLFAVPHIANIAALGGGSFMMLPYIISGLLYGWAAYRSGSLWMSTALHLMNNYTSLVFIGTKGDVLPSAAPFLIAVPNLTVVTFGVLFQSILMFLALSYLLKRAEG